MPNTESQSLWSMIAAGGFAMYPLLLCSFATWAVIFERMWSFRRLGRDLHSFHLEAMNKILGGDRSALRALCLQKATLPTSLILLSAFERLDAKDERVQARWQEAVERRRQLVNQDLKSYLWILGTIGSASPFIGLFGTVVGILRSFQDMARTGSGGFAVVAAGISESLIATAVGIVVAVVAVMAYNAFQTHLNKLILTVKLQTEELVEMLGVETDSAKG